MLFLHEREKSYLSRKLRLVLAPAWKRALVSIRLIAFLYLPKNVCRVIGRNDLWTEEVQAVWWYWGQKDGSGKVFLSLALSQKKKFVVVSLVLFRFFFLLFKKSQMKLSGMMWVAKDVDVVHCSLACQLLHTSGLNKIHHRLFQCTLALIVQVSDALLECWNIFFQNHIHLIFDILIIVEESAVT